MRSPMIHPLILQQFRVFVFLLARGFKEDMQISARFIGAIRIFPLPRPPSLSWFCYLRDDELEVGKYITGKYRAQVPGGYIWSKNYHDMPVIPGLTDSL